MPRIRLWWWWIGVVLLVSGPWLGLTATPRWDRVHWIPFTDPEDKPRDFIANVVLFIPFGISFARGRRGQRRVLDTAASAALVSVAAEATQLFGNLRNPSATDVTTAIAGALAGAAFMAWVESERSAT